MPALVAVAAGETIGQDPAFEVAAQITFHIRRNRIPLGIGLPLAGEPGLQVLLDRQIGDGALGAPSSVDAVAVPAGPGSRGTGQGIDIRVGS
jgi:hypothetical protein